jgi:oligopeptide/dipeptide ABC transporter ATP-binding protein
VTSVGMREQGAEERMIDVSGLAVTFRTPRGDVRAVRGVSFEVKRGETVGVVGESGSGKSVTAMSLLQLLPSGGVEVRGDHVRVMGLDVLHARNRDLSKLRGGAVGVVFQDPFRGLTPTMRVGEQVAEVIRRHRPVSRDAAWGLARATLERVGIPDVERSGRKYPHQFSGGQRQRIMIAIAIACSPKFVIADEPTTALDVTTRAQILDLLLELRREMGMGVLLITHDISVIARVCDRVLVMYGGRIVEDGSTSAVFRNPQHPYTAALLASTPRLDQPDKPLRAIPGEPVDAHDEITGCSFAPRCPIAAAQCVNRPELEPTTVGHLAACWRPGEWG